MGIAMTTESLSRALGREVEELHLTVAKSMVLGLDVDMLSQSLGVEKSEIEDLIQTQDYKDIRLLVGANHVENQVKRDYGWDEIEQSSVNRLAVKAERENDTDTLLRMASVANRAIRRTAPPKDAILDPSQAGVRVPLTLTRRYTEQLNHQGAITSRSETQQISVLDGSAVNPTFKEVQDLLRPVIENPGVKSIKAAIERATENADSDFEALDMSTLEQMVRDFKNG